MPLPRVVVKGKLEPWVFQVTGVILLIIFGMAIVVTGRKEPELLMAATGLYAYGSTKEGGDSK